MQCPECSYEPTLKEAQDSPNDCVKCGANFESSARQKKLQNSLPLSPEVKSVIGKFPGAQPVVVIDVDMKFWSMVELMVKGAVAAIPATLIIYLLITLAGFVIGELSSIASKKSPPGPREPSHSEYLDIQAEPEVAYFLIGSRDNARGGFDIELKRNAPSGVIYQLKSIDCSSRKISLDSESSSYSGISGKPKQGEKYTPSPGSVDDYLVSRICR